MAGTMVSLAPVGRNKGHLLFHAVFAFGPQEPGLFEVKGDHLRVLPSTRGTHCPC